MWTLTNLMWLLLSGVLAILLYLVFIYWRNPVLIKLGLRNIPRRPTQSILIIIGLTLSTLIIVSSLAIGDTLNYSVRRQAVDAYGMIDEIVAPPLLSLLTTLASDDASDEEASQAQAELEQLTAGGLTSVLTVLSGGLPRISEERFRQLQVEAQDEPLIDGVAGSIIFPTIVRDLSSGQGEPFGFIFAVDDDYDQQFGLTTVAGEPVEMEELAPGVGNIFAQASNLFNAAADLGGQVGLGNVSISDVALVTAAVGAALTAGGEEGLDLSTIEIDVATLQELGINTAPLEEAGLETLSLENLGLTQDRLDSLGVTTTTVSLDTLAIPGVDAGTVSTLTNDLLGALNLNTLGSEIDRVLAQAGLQLRQGDVYLNRLGAEQLNAKVGDVVEIFVGPIPVPFRVKAIVEQAGPMAAFSPVVMLRLEEAQKLLFMRDNVNTILVSNLGDEMSGLEHTDAVGTRLRELAMDPAGLERIALILRRPAVRAQIDAGAVNVDDPLGEDFDGPAFIGDALAGFFQFADFQQLVQGFPAALDQPGIAPEFRSALANQRVREWLLELPLSSDDHRDLTTALTELNEFDLIDPLNKSNVVTVAGVGGTVFTSIFSLFGFFSILAGVLLIFLIFVMLAAERRSELGMARAIGVQRRDLVRMFVTEGLIYDLLAALFGVLLGVGISYLMVGFIGGLFNNLTGQISEYGGIFRFRFRTTTSSIIIAYCVGVLFTFVVVTVAATRVSRLNIVAAIRDLPENSIGKRRSLGGQLLRVLFWLLLMGAGAYLIQQAGTERLSLLLAGSTLVLAGVMLLIGGLLERTAMRTEQIQRVVYTVIGGGLLAIYGLPWSSWLGRSAVDMVQDGPWVLVSFALTMPMIILGAILVVMFNADVLTWLITLLLGGFGALTPVLKTAIAYPLSTRFRTGMAMLLFAMVISTVTIMTVVIEATQTLVAPNDERTAGFEISTSFSILSFFNPIEDLEAQIARQTEFPAEDIAAVGAVATDFAEAQRFEQEGATWRSLPIVGVSEGYWRQAAQVYTLAMRAPEFADDAAVWAALQSRDDVALLTRDMLFATEAAAAAAGERDFGGPMMDEDGREFGFGRRLFDDVTLDGTTLPPITLTVRAFDEGGTPGAEQSVQVIGVIDEAGTLAGQGLQMSGAAYAAILGTDSFAPDNYYLKVREGADVRAVAQEVERTFLSGGLNASVMAESFAQGQALTRGILRLFQGFMALGLLVGIAALGVISSRTVVERRQQIGMLRAIGFQSNMVTFSFLLEASFIALSGLLIGTLAGVTLGQNVVRQLLSALADERVFATPWLQIGGIVLLAYVCALLATLVPAFQAARIYPAEALRYE